jgi:hypothetical protein
MAASFNALCTMVKRYYERVWTDWYSGIPAVDKALLLITPCDYSASYSPSRNLIVIPVPEGNLEDADILDEEGWPIWKIDLIHEMLHEWQKKQPSISTPGSKLLYAKYGTAASCGEGHGPDFFQAIQEKAPYFHMTPEQLSEQIGSSAF